MSRCGVETDTAGSESQYRIDHDHYIYIYTNVHTYINIYYIDVCIYCALHIVVVYNNWNYNMINTFICE